MQCTFEKEKSTLKRQNKRKLNRQGQFQSLTQLILCVGIPFSCLQLRQIQIIVVHYVTDST